MAIEKTTTSPKTSAYDGACQVTPLSPAAQEFRDTHQGNLPPLPLSSYPPRPQVFSLSYVHEGQFEDAPEDDGNATHQKNNKRTLSPTTASSFDELGAIDALTKLASAAATAERVALNSTNYEIIGSSPPQGSQIAPNDVLCGRGGLTNHHPGNVYFRKLVRQLQPDYLRASKRDKAGIARRIVDNVRKLSPPGRFLKKDPSHVGVWKDIGNRKAREKTSQALREGAPELRETQGVCVDVFPKGAEQQQHVSQAHTRSITPPPIQTVSLIGNKRKLDDSQILPCSAQAFEGDSAPSSPRGPRLLILKARRVTQGCR